MILIPTIGPLWDDGKRGLSPMEAEAGSEEGGGGEERRWV